MDYNRTQQSFYKQLKRDMVSSFNSLNKGKLDPQIDSIPILKEVRNSKVNKPPKCVKRMRDRPEI